MATTYRNKESKFWYARFTDRTGKRVSRSTKSESRREAKRISEDMESAERKVVKSDPETPQMIFQTIRIAEMELQRGTLTTARAEELIRQMLRAANPNAVDSSFRRFAGAWLDRIEGDVTEHTWTGYSNAIKLALTALGTKGEGSLHKLTVGDMEAVQAAMAVGRRGKTANDYMTVIRRILESAVEKDLIQKNPSRAIKLRSKSDSRTHAPFTVAEGWGTYEQTAENPYLKSRISIRYGKLRVRSLALVPAMGTQPGSAKVAVNGRALDCKVEFKDRKAIITLVADVVIPAGETMEICLGPAAAAGGPPNGRVTPSNL